MKTKTIFLILLFLGMNQFLNSQIIYVDVNNNTGNENGTEAHPFNTIKEGIHAAVPGSTVMIGQGTYIPDESWSGNDHTLFLKAGVNLIGESRDNTIISGIVVDQQASNLSIGLEKLKFDEFHFARATHAGPFSDKIIIRNCATTLINLPFGAGVPLNDTTPGPNYGFLIENNDLGTEGIVDFKQGSGVSDLTVKNNSCAYIYIKSGGGYNYMIESNQIQHGIFDASGTNTTTISNNTILNGTIVDRSGGNQYGVEDEIIENNTISADENSPAFIGEIRKAGISSSARSGTLRNNTISCTGKVHGIFSNAGAPLNIINNSITLDEVQEPSLNPLEEGGIGIYSSSGWGYVNGNKIHGGEIGYYTKAGTVEFANNIIEKSYTGFFGSGAEDVHHNIIKDCYGDGFILNGQKGPLSYNMVIDNAGAGIRIMKTPIDLGGGDDNSPGKNTLQGNGDFDLYIETLNALHPTLYARHNIWDHETSDEISQLDIRDGSDSTGLVVVDFTPFGSQGINDQSDYFKLNAYPNPFSASTVISWQVPVRCRPPAVLKVFDLMGKELRTLVDEEIAPGEHWVTFDATGLPAGIYFYQLQANGVVETMKMVVNR